MPDDLKVEDEDEGRQVGGRQAQYDSDDVVEAMDGAETAQAAHGALSPRPQPQPQPQT